MWTPARRRRLIVTAVLIIAVPCQAEAVEYYNLSAISTDEIRGQLGRIKEADPGRRKLGADGVAPGPLRNQSSNGADLHLLGSDRMDPVALPAQTIEKPKAPQDRIHQLTAQQEQPPDAETDRARKEAERLRLQLSHTTEELKTYRDRVHQLEAQLKQAPGAVETNRAREQDEGLHLQLAHTTEELKAYRDRVHQLEAQLKRVPAAAELDKARKQGDELRSQLVQTTE